MRKFVLIEGSPAKVLAENSGILLVLFSEGYRQQFSERDVEEIDDPQEINRLEDEFS